MISRQPEWSRQPSRFGIRDARIATEAGHAGAQAPGFAVRLGMVFGVILVIVFGGVACEPSAVGSRDDPTDRDACTDRPVRLAVAASLREIAKTLTTRLKSSAEPIDVETSFGASSALAHQLELGAPIDLLVSADAALVVTLADRGLIARDSIREIARGQLVLATFAGSPFDGFGLEAIHSPQLKRLGVPSPAVPLGRYGHAWLERRDLLGGLAGKIVATENARANLTAVDQGHVDIAILYETDVRLRPSLSVLHRPVEADYPSIRYVVARATRAPDCPEIERVLRTWESQQTRDDLAAAGFGLPMKSAPSATEHSVPGAGGA